MDLRPCPFCANTRLTVATFGNLQVQYVVVTCVPNATLWDHAPLGAVRQGMPRICGTKDRDCGSLNSPWGRGNSTDWLIGSNLLTLTEREPHPGGAIRF